MVENKQIDLEKFDGVEELRYTSQYPFFKENIDLLKQVLLPVELKCIQVAIKESHPQTTRQFYTSILMETFSKVTASHHPKLSKIPEYKTLVHKGRSFTIRTRLIENVLRHREIGIKFPSYSKVNNILKRLKSWGFLMTRKEDKTYWLLHPRFSIEFKDKFKDIIKL